MSLRPAWYTQQIPDCQGYIARSSKTTQNKTRAVTKRGVGLGMGSMSDIPALGKWEQKELKSD